MTVLVTVGRFLSEHAAYVFLYLLLPNLLAFLLYGLDKYKARRGKWRIPEATLLVFAALGGAIGALMAMQMFHHKTQHKKFTLGVPLLLTLHVVLFVLLFLVTGVLH